MATIDTPEARAAIPPHIPFIGDPDRLAALRPDLVVEAAGRRAIDQWAPAALQHARAMIIASTSAFVDDALLPRLQAIAEQYGSRILIPSGAIGAIDAIASAAVLGLDEAVHQIVNPPAAWQGTPAEKLFDPATLTDREGVLRRLGAAGGRRLSAERQRHRRHLAGRHRHRPHPRRAGGRPGGADQRAPHQGARRVRRAQIVLRNNPLATNPKSSELTALSLVRLIEQQGRTVVI